MSLGGAGRAPLIEPLAHFKARLFNSASPKLRLGRKTAVCQEVVIEIKDTSWNQKPVISTRNVISRLIRTAEAEGLTAAGGKLSDLAAGLSGQDSCQCLTKQHDGGLVGG